MVVGRSVLDMTSPLRTVLVAALATLALAGCSSDATTGSPSADSTSATPSASVTTQVDAQFPTYVALGDSYTAAPLVPDTDTSNGCLRSTNNYPALVAAALPGTSLTDVSCSGASSESMIGVQKTNTGLVPAQFDALTEDTDLVTIGIGGNDANLFATMVGACSQVTSKDPHGSPCRDKLTAGGKDQLRAAVQQIGGHVTAIVKGIHDRSPQAKVLVVGYPQILPAHGTCPDLLPLADGDVAYARGVLEDLVTTIRKATAAAGDAEYVDLFAATAGHDICAKDPWINGAQTDPQAALAFHPFEAEQQKAAELVLAALK
ncbi:SGNH/GDSL hydrolase family protein [Nocardioides ginsengisegetis]